MPQLKPSFVEDIKKSVKDSCFTINDFKIDFPDSGDTYLKITFIHKPEYQLYVAEKIHHDNVVIKDSFGMSTRTEKNKSTVLFASTKPGKHKLEDIIIFTDFDDVIRTIPTWCDQIKEDLYSLAPIVDPMESIRNEFEAQFEKMIDDPESYFTEEEKEVVEKKFDELFKKFEELKEEYSITKKQLETIRNEFDEFKNSSSAYPKGVWAKITNNKLVDIVSSFFKTPEGRKFVLEQVKKLMVD